MQLTELLYQKVKDLAGQGQLSLKPGYVAIVSKAASVRAALVAPICPSPEDQKKLSDGGAGGNARVGVGMLSGDGTPHRILRELGGSRQLQRFNAATKKYSTVSEDALEIDSFLRVECGMPGSDAYTGFFVLEVNELPSLRGKSAAAASEAYVDTARVRALKDELELTKKFEATQDRLFKVAQRLHELTTLKEKLDEAQADVDAVDAELKRSPWTGEELKDLIARAGRAQSDLKKRDDALGDLMKKKQKALSSVPPPPEAFLKSPWFLGGAALGAGLDALAFALRQPLIGLLGLVPWLLALIAVLRWIYEDEADKEAAAFLKELKEREEGVRRAYDEQQKPLKEALKSAKVDSAGDLVEIFQQREIVVQRKQVAQERLDKIRVEPDVSRLPVEIPLLTSEKAKLEDTVQTMGFSRGMSEIEGDLKHAMGITDAKKSAALPEEEVPKQLIDRAAELLSLTADELWAQMTARFSSYLTALTDRRVTGGKADPKGLLLLAAADGRTGTFSSLPAPLRDLVYTALRLTLLERVAGYKRLPIVIDDAFGILEPAKRGLVAKMLKGIATQTQVLHRVAEPPPQGVADLVVQA